jgi:DNA polymerase-3 subunit delta
MIILLYGEDTYRSRQKLKEIIEQYQAKHKTGLNLIRLEEGDLDFDKVRERIEAVSMFDEKKLIVLENIFKNKDFLESFADYAKKNKLKENQDIILVILQAGKLAIAPFKSWLTMSEEFKPLSGVNLVNWLKKEANEHQIAISPAALKKMVAYLGDDLWQINSELNKLVSYKAGQPVSEEDIDLLTGAKIEVNIFKTLDALAQRDKKTALKLLHEHLNQGENEIYLLTMFIYQLRSLLKLKDLISRGAPYQALAKKSGLHPYAVKKNWSVLQNFSLDQLKRIYQRLLEIDLAIKKGRLDGQTALDLLVAEI